MMRRFNNFLLVALVIAAASCTQPMDPVVESVVETKSILQGKRWILVDYVIKVKNPDIPAPMLINIGDSSIEAGNYHLPNSLPGDSDFPQIIMEFSTDNKILIDSAYTNNFVGLGGKYFIQNQNEININPKKVERLKYKYYYSPDNKQMTFTLTEEQASKAIEKATQKLIDDAVNGTPDKIGEAISDKLHNSPKIKAAIEKWLKNAIAGKLPSIFDQTKVKTAEELSKRLRAHLLDSINWKNVLKEAIDAELNKIQSDTDPALANDITTEITTQIGEELSENALYDILLPYVAVLELQDNESEAEKIAFLIEKLLGKIFSEANLEKIVEVIWKKFTDLDPAQIDSIAVELTTVVETNWLNVDTLAQVILPITSKIDATPLFKMDELAQEATDSLEVFIDKLDNRFPDLGLNPNYDSIELILQKIFIAAKPFISVQGPLKVAEEGAQVILSTILTTENIESAFVAALDYLQTIPPDVAAEKIAAWLVSLENKIGPELLNWLTEKLGPILNGDASYIIANKVHDFAITNFGFGTLKELTIKELNAAVAINGRVLAEHIAKALIDKKLAKEGVDLEALSRVIFGALHDDNSGNGLGERIKQHMADNDMLWDGKTPDIIAKIISFILYAEAWNNFKIANNFEEATIIIQHD
jgi:hypothetical protein